MSDAEKAEAAQALATSEAQRELPPTDPRFVIEPIGKIPYGPGGPYSNCKMLKFEETRRPDSARGMTHPLGDFISPHEQVNEFFETHQNLLNVGTWVSADAMTISVMVTNTLNDDQLEIVNERAHIVEAMVQEALKKKAEALEAAEKDVENQEKKLRELAKIGEHCMHNHGAVTKRLKAKK